MNEQYFAEITRTATGNFSWRQIFGKIFRSRQPDEFSVIEPSHHSSSSDPDLLVNTSLSPSPQSLEQITWIGTIQYDEESISVQLILQDENGVLSGQLQVVDPINSQLIRLADMSGTRVGDNISLTSNTDLTITATLQTNSLTGIITFPPRNNEPGLEANISLNRENKIYLPIVIR